MLLVEYNDITRGMSYVRDEVGPPGTNYDQSTPDQFKRFVGKKRFNKFGGRSGFDRTKSRVQLASRNGN